MYIWRDIMHFKHISTLYNWIHVKKVIRKNNNIVYIKIQVHKIIIIIMIGEKKYI